MTNVIPACFIAILMAYANIAAAQKFRCTYSHLSDTFNYSLVCDKGINENGDEYIPRIHVSIIRKSDKKLVQKITSYNSDPLGDLRFFRTSRSYITGYRKNASIVDGDYGDIVVADFNFDGREDFAVKTDQCPTGAGYETFDFFLQDKHGKFIKDKFLTTKMIGCPYEIDTRKHTLLISVPILCGSELWTRKFKYNPATGKWKEGKIIIIK
jgi:hypothetical protein